MKKVTFLSLILVLLAVSVIPVMAAGGPPNGHGNGVSAGQGNNGGNRDHERQQDREQDRLQDGERTTNPGSIGNGNHEQTRMRTPFYLQGTISAIDTGTGRLTVTLMHGNAQVKEYLGTDLTLQTSDGTLIFQITQGEETDEGTEQTATPTTNSNPSSDGSDSNRIPITFDQLVIGQKVTIHGNLVDGVYTARLITVYIQMHLDQPAVEEP